MLSWVSNIFNWAAGKVDDTIRGWVHDVIAGFYGFLHILFGEIVGAWHDLSGSVDAISHELAEWGAELYGAFHYIFKVWIPHTIAWINSAIVEPLLGTIAWIAHEGSIIWGYISNPVKLVDLIWDDLLANFERTAWKTAEALGRFAIVLVVRNIGLFLTLVEDVIDALI
jgi:hypothetical protein